MIESVVDQRGLTVLSLINRSAEYLSARNIESPRLTAELLLSHALGCGRSELISQFEAVPAPDQVSQFDSCLTRRLAHEPVQYIIGSAEFMGLRFEVDSRVLIPRPETEVLVEQVVVHARQSQKKSWLILDVGTGSGNIAVSLAKFLPDAAVIAVDNSARALEVASRNVRLHGLEDRVRAMYMDFPLESTWFGAPEFDLVVSNPPYIAEGDLASLPPEIRQYEPLAAVRAPGDGLDFFRSIASETRVLLKDGGWLFFEVGFGQRDAVCRIMSECRYDPVRSIRDYSGIPRVVKAKRQPSSLN